MTPWQILNADVRISGSRNEVTAQIRLIVNTYMHCVSQLCNIILPICYLKQPGASYLSKTTAEKLGSAKTTSPVLSSLVALRPLPFSPASNSSALSMFPRVIAVAKQNTEDTERKEKVAEGGTGRGSGEFSWNSQQYLQVLAPLSSAYPLLQPKINVPPLEVVPPPHRGKGASSGRCGWGRGNM